MNTAEIITDGLQQSIHLPADCRIEATEVYVKRLGKSLLIVPKDSDPWQLFSQSLEEFTDDFMLDRDQPGDQDRKSPFE